MSELLSPPPAPLRIPLPDTRDSVTIRMRIRCEPPDGERQYYLICGMYPSGHLGEIFIRSITEGDPVKAALDRFATSMSIGLQHGIPMAVYTRKLLGVRCTPCGMAYPPKGFPLADGQVNVFVPSIWDYMAQLLDWRFHQGVCQWPRSRRLT